MADHAQGRLGHFLPYLLGQRLRAVAWPPDGGERALVLLLLALMALYGAGLGYVLNHANREELAGYVPKIVGGLYTFLVAAALLNDFIPSLRPVVRAVPEHCPVSNRLCVLTAFLLDLLTLRRLLQVLLLLVLALVAPTHAAVPGLGLLLVLAGAVLSFGLRLLGTMGQWRHPLLLGYLAALASTGWWLLHPAAPYAGWLAVLACGLPWLVGAAQLYWLGPRFAARYLPPALAPAASGSHLLDRLPLTWRVYGRVTWLPLLIGIVLKLVALAAMGYFFVQAKDEKMPSYLYLFVLPVLSFTYVNNNLFGYLRTVSANELHRLGLTSRLAALYLLLAGPTVLAECVLTAVVILVVFPVAHWPLLGLLPLGAVALLSVGLWGSLYQAKPILKAVDFTNMRNNSSTLVNLVSLVLAATLFAVPRWDVRIGLAALAAAAALWPLRQLRRNHGPLRRKLWQGIGG